VGGGGGGGGGGGSNCVLRRTAERSSQIGPTRGVSLPATVRVLT